MKIFNKFIWSKKEPSNKNDIWFDGSTWRMYTEEAWQSFTLPVDAADTLTKMLENASEVYQEKLNAGYGIIIEGNTISVDDSNVWEAIETLQQNKVEQTQLDDYVPLDRWASTSQVLMDNISELASIKLDKANVATINGQSLIKGGNIVIPTGGESYDDTEIKQQITELSAETHKLQPFKNPLKTISFAEMDYQKGFISAEGSFQSSNEYVTMPLMKVSEGDNIYVLKGDEPAGAFRIALYDSQKKFISRPNIDVNGYVIPNGIEYITIVAFTGNAHGELRPTPLSELSEICLIGFNPMPTISENQQNILLLKAKEEELLQKNDAVSKEIDIFRNSIRTLSFADLGYQQGFIGPDGIFSINNEFATFPLMRVCPNDKVYVLKANAPIGAFRIALYDSDKKFKLRDNITSDGYIIPNGVQYVSIVAFIGEHNAELRPTQISEFAEMSLIGFNPMPIIIENQNAIALLGKTSETTQTTTNGILLEQGIMLLGASFSSNEENNWFTILEEKLQQSGYDDIAMINKAIGSTNIMYDAVRFKDGWMFAPNEFEQFDVLLINHVHNKDIYTLRDVQFVKDGQTNTIKGDVLASMTASQYEESGLIDYFSANVYDKDTGTERPLYYGYRADEYYAAAYDYIIKKYKALCYAARNDANSKWYCADTSAYNVDYAFGKPCQIVLVTNWNDGRPIINKSMAQLAEKWEIPCIELYKDLGISAKIKMGESSYSESYFYARDGEYNSDLGLFVGKHMVYSQSQPYPTIQKKVAKAIWKHLY